ncbi:hypothetical protein V3C99_008359 [Haemonchus contortus]
MTARSNTTTMKPDHTTRPVILTLIFPILVAIAIMSTAPVAADSTLTVCKHPFPSFRGDACADLLKQLKTEETVSTYIGLLIGVLIQIKREISDSERLCDTFLTENKVFESRTFFEFPIKQLTLITSRKYTVPVYKPLTLMMLIRIYQKSMAISVDRS